MSDNVQTIFCRKSPVLELYPIVENASKNKHICTSRVRQNVDKKKGQPNFDKLLKFRNKSFNFLCLEKMGGSKLTTVQFLLFVEAKMCQI